MRRAHQQLEQRNQRPEALKYRQLELDKIKKGRRGKHHELVEGIFRELETVPAGLAIEIPLADVGGVGLANLRSAVHRAAMTRRLPIGTLADGNNLYVWNTTQSEANFS